MPQTHNLDPNAASAFLSIEVKDRLRVELEKVANDAAILHPWEPMLDSQRVVGIVLVIEPILQSKLPPDKVVRKGGYKSVDEAMKDMLGRIETVVAERNKPKVGK